jgi:catechol 2,3-dioxygenase-like lactoylglutathione lyase family enzyme
VTCELDHVQLSIPPRHEAAIVDFYETFLGAQELEKPDALRPNGGCWLQVGALALHFGVEEGFRPHQKSHLAFRLANYDEVVRLLQRDGYDVTVDTRLADVRRCYVGDPVGNRLELIAG